VRNSKYSLAATSAVAVTPSTTISYCRTEYSASTVLRECVYPEDFTPISDGEFTYFCPTVSVSAMFNLRSKYVAVADRRRGEFVDERGHHLDDGCGFTGPRTALNDERVVLPTHVSRIR
jgi:hypothetical protein